MANLRIAPNCAPAQSPFYFSNFSLTVVCRVCRALTSFVNDFCHPKLSIIYGLLWSAVAVAMLGQQNWINLSKRAAF
jgi:hypothetical protein